MGQQTMGRNDWVFVGLRLGGVFLWVQTVIALPAVFLMIYLGGGDLSYGGTSGFSGDLSGLSTGMVFVAFSTCVLSVGAGYLLAVKTVEVHRFLLGHDAAYGATAEESPSGEFKSDFRVRKRASRAHRSQGESTVPVP